ncbi:MAG: hypothetical protein SF066_05605 [Thermoanaerobaculia bacterium]|nr:hypothetical protein [Thermoanaerobaculia bacterium]
MFHRRIDSRPRRLAGALLALLLSALPATAFDLNGFLPAAGEGQVALSVTAEGYDQFWVGETKVSDPGVGEVELTSQSLWFQYGLAERFALVGSVAHVDADSDGLAGFGEQDLQDLAVLLEMRLLESGPHSVVEAAGVRTPLGDYEDDLPVDVGDGTTDALLRLVYLLRAGGFYFSQQVGHDLRGGDAPNGWPLFTEIGYTFGRVTVNGFLSWQITDDGTDIGDPGFTFPSNREEYQRVGAKVYARVSERFGLSLVAFDTLDGRNTGETSGFSAGLSLRF